MHHPLTTADGLTLHVQHWPAGVAARGTVLIVHGLGEHSGRYTDVAADIVAMGWHVLAYDQRGHGRSQGLRGCVRRPDDLLADLGRVIDAARELHSGPLVLLGHSMGGVVASRFVAEGTQPAPHPAWYREVQGLVLSSPALAVDLSWAQRWSLRLLSRLAANLAVHNGVRRDWLSRDPNVVAAYRADPLVHDRISPTLGTFIWEGGAFVRRCAPAWRVPTLLMYSAIDRSVAPRGSVEFAAAAPAGVVRAQAYAELYHEILNEPERARVLDLLRSWLHDLR